MSSSTALTLVLIVLGLLVGLWLLEVGARLAVAFARLVVDMNVILAVLMFVLFPPLLLVFLAGYAILNYRKAG